MRTETEIKAEIETLRVDYQASAQPELSDRIKKASHELSELYSSGANVCPSCGEAPFGMLRCAEHMDRGRVVPALYEVGCLVCPPVVDNGKRRSLSAQGATPQEAVNNWNADKMIEDRRTVQP